jgi:hypothetical protein
MPHTRSIAAIFSRDATARRRLADAGLTATSINAR